jgi:DNA-binding NarL/FixJ family response regulator
MRSSASESPSSAQSPVSVVLSCFDDLFARGLHQLIASDPSLVIVAENVEHGRIPVVLRAHQPGVAILDADALRKPAEVRELSVCFPDVRLVLFAKALSAVESAQMLAFGASACLGRDTQSRDVLNAIHLASRGLQLIPRQSGFGSAVLAGGHLLTQREAEVLQLLQRGRSNPQIAIELQVGLETVRTHARNIYRKLGVSSRRELIAPPAGERDCQADLEVHSPRRRVTGRRSRSRGGHDTRHM